MPTKPYVDALRYFWGKARSVATAGMPAAVVMHLLIAHMLDVAAVAIVLPGSSERLGLDKRQLGMLVAVHDIGKLSPAFQQKVPLCRPEQAFGLYEHGCAQKI